MPDDYLDLYKLRETENPFQVERVIDEDLQASPGCQLPTDTPLDLDLTPIEVILPPLECKFDNLIPLIPLPEVCHPTVAGTLNITDCGGLPFGTATITRIDDTCDYVLNGDIEICIPQPCADGFTFSGSVDISSTSEVVTLGGTITLAPDGVCGAILSGSIELDAALDNVCTESTYTVDIVDESQETWELELGEGVQILVNPVVTISKTGETKCNTTFLFSLDMADSSLVGASWEAIAFCDGGSTVLKKILVASA